MACENNKEQEESTKSRDNGYEGKERVDLAFGDGNSK
jgi:hypothetical protein